MSKDAMKLALEALKSCGWNDGYAGPKQYFYEDLVDEAITALREALAEQPAPVQQILSAFPLLDDEGLDEEKHHCEWTLQQDRKRLHAMLAAAPQPAQQEPVAWMDGPHLVMRSDWRERANYKGPWVDFGRAIPDSWTPVLYTSPPAQRKENT